MSRADVVTDRGETDGFDQIAWNRGIWQKRLAAVRRNWWVCDQSARQPAALLRAVFAQRLLRGMATECVIPLGERRIAAKNYGVR